MPIRITVLALVSSVAWPAAGLLAQEGFPLDGTWRGDWGPTVDDRTPVVIVMKWDGENINGTINPGPSSFQFTSAILDASSWTVNIEAQPPGEGNIMITATLRDIGSYNRFIEGTWTQDGGENSFRVTRE